MELLSVHSGSGYTATKVLKADNAPGSWFVTWSNVAAFYASTQGTDEQRRIATRQYLCSQIEAAMGAEFLPSPTSPLIREIDFDPTTGRVLVMGIVGG